MGMGMPEMDLNSRLNASGAASELLLDRLRRENEQLALELQQRSGPKLKDFVALLEGNAEVNSLKDDVNKLATSFPMPGFGKDEMRYTEVGGPAE